MLVTIYHQNPNIVKSAGYHPRPIDSVSLKGAVRREPMNCGASH
jgi:hypothetical protein